MNTCKPGSKWLRSLQKLSKQNREGPSSRDGNSSWYCRDKKIRHLKLLLCPRLLELPCVLSHVPIVPWLGTTFLAPLMSLYQPPPVLGNLQKSPTLVTAETGSQKDSKNLEKRAILLLTENERGRPMHSLSHTCWLLWNSHSHGGRNLSKHGLRFCFVRSQWLISLRPRAPRPPVDGPGVSSEGNSRDPLCHPTLAPFT